MYNLLICWKYNVYIVASKFSALKRILSDCNVVYQLFDAMVYKQMTEDSTQFSMPFPIILPMQLNLNGSSQ